MRILELPSGVRCIISNEEAVLLDQIHTAGGEILKRDLDERSQQVATQLTQRDVLTRARVQGKLMYKLPHTDIWRI